MSYNLAADRATETEQLLADIAAAIHATDGSRWAERGMRVQDLLHASGHHNGDVDADGRLVISSGHDCPKCSMHPARLPAETTP